MLSSTVKPPQALMKEKKFVLRILLSFCVFREYAESIKVFMENMGANLGLF
jgi:hypothetical protein